jgi:hypothetical protein
MISILSAVAGYAWDVTNLSCSRVRWISYLDRDSVTQIVMVCSLPILFYTIPRAASVYLPLICSGLVVLMVQQKIREAEISEKIVKQNEELEGICKSFQDLAEGLEKGISGCLKVAEQKEAVIQAVNQMDEGVDQRLERVKLRIQTLSAVCQKAQSEESVMQLMATVQANEKRLTKLTLETGLLNQQIDAIIQELQTYVSQLGKHDAQMQEKAAILTALIEKWERREDGNKSNC